MPNINYTDPIQPESGDKHKESANKGQGKVAGNTLKIIAIVVGVIVIFVAGIIMLVFSVLSGVTDTAGEFMDALKLGAPGIAYEMGSADFRAQGPREEFEVYVKENSVLSDIESYSLNSFNMENNYGTARGTITSKDGQIAPIMLELVKENDKWKVLNINLEPPAEVEDDDFEDFDTDFMDF